MLECCYGERYDKIDGKYASTDSLIFHIKLFRTAHKYDVADLTTTIEEHIRCSWPGPIDAQELESQGVFEALRILYEMPPALTETLRKDFMYRLHPHFASPFIHKQQLHDLITEHGLLGSDILRFGMASELLSSGFEYSCVNCDVSFIVKSGSDRSDLIRCPECKSGVYEEGIVDYLGFGFQKRNTG